MNRQRPTRPRKQDPTTEQPPVRPYQAPELQEYGSLKELTQTLSTQTPGDGFGGSYAT